MPTPAAWGDATKVLMAVLTASQRKGGIGVTGFSHVSSFAGQFIEPDLSSMTNTSSGTPSTPMIEPAHDASPIDAPSIDAPSNVASTNEPSVLSPSRLSGPVSGTLASDAASAGPASPPPEPAP